MAGFPMLPVFQCSKFKPWGADFGDMADLSIFGFYPLKIDTKGGGTLLV